MAKIILTSRYIKNPAKEKAGKLIQYMGTRESVEKLPIGIDNSPATKKQKILICDAITAVPESMEYPEFKLYNKIGTKSSATEYLDAVLERNPDKIERVKNLIKYYGERPGVERLGKHGLFSFTDDKIDIDEVADEVANHEGILWTHVVSLTREDAERLGYNNANKWKELLCRNTNLVDGKIEISEPKTKSSVRTIVLPQSLLNMLSEYKQKINSQWIFPSPVKGFPKC